METPLVRTRTRIFFMSVICIGLGDLYVGRPKRAIGIALTFLLFLTLVDFGGNDFKIYIIAALGLIASFAGSIASAQMKIDTPEKNGRNYQNLTCYLIFLFSLTAPASVLRMYIPKNFSVPSASMLPTVMSGDILVADLHTYQNREPKLGEVILYKDSQGVTFVKRVVGIPGDLIEMNSECTLTRNHEVIPKVAVADLKIGSIIYKTFTQDLNGTQYQVALETGSCIATRNSPTELPADTYFVLGDNLDNSKDSRSFGPVFRKQLVGRAEFIFHNGLSRFGVRVNPLGN